MRTINCYEFFENTVVNTIPHIVIHFFEVAIIVIAVTVALLWLMKKKVPCQCGTSVTDTLQKQT